MARLAERPVQRCLFLSQIAYLHSTAPRLGLHGAPVGLVGVERVLGDIVTAVAVLIAVHDGCALSSTPMHRNCRLVVRTIISRHLRCALLQRHHHSLGPLQQFRLWTDPLRLSLRAARALQIAGGRTRKRHLRTALQLRRRSEDADCGQGSRRAGARAVRTSLTVLRRGRRPALGDRDVGRHGSDGRAGLSAGRHRRERGSMRSGSAHRRRGRRLLLRRARLHRERVSPDRACA